MAVVWSGCRLLHTARRYGTTEPTC